MSLIILFSFAVTNIAINQKNVCIFAIVKSLTLYMEPPSSINIEAGLLAGQQSDDPGRAIPVDSYIVVSHSENASPDDGFVVCAYSALTGLAYLGTCNPIAS